MSFAMRQPCKKCGATHGSIETRNGQDCVFCGSCGAYAYCAPKTETGREVRTVKTTHAAITTSQRYRIIERAARRCELCGSAKDLHVGHIIKVGHRMGLSDREINCDDNLLALCAECNLGMSDRPLPMKILVQLLRARYNLDGKEGAA